MNAEMECSWLIYQVSDINLEDQKLESDIPYDWLKVTQHENEALGEF